MKTGKTAATGAAGQQVTGAGVAAVTTAAAATPDPHATEALAAIDVLTGTTAERFAGISTLGPDILGALASQPSAQGANIAAFKNRFVDLTAAAKQRVQADAQTFLILGRVVDANGAGLKGYKLALSDASGEIAERVKPRPSDAAGNFTLHLRIGELPPELAGASIYVRVSDRYGSEVFAPSDPLVIRAGEIGSFTALAPAAPPPKKSRRTTGA
jgi:hypothetical protein